MPEHATHRFRGLVGEGARDVAPPYGHRADFAGGRSFSARRFASVEVVAVEAPRLVVLRREGGAGAGEETDEERHRGGRQDLADALPAKIHNLAADLPRAEPHHLSLFSLPSSVALSFAAFSYHRQLAFVRALSLSFVDGEFPLGPPSKNFGR